MFKPEQMRLNNLFLFSMITTLVLLFVPFLEEYVWSPFWTIIVFLAVVLLDFITAVASSWRERKFVTEKAIKVPFVICAYVVLFAVLHSLGRVIEAFNMGDMLNPIAFDYLAKSVYFLCFAINLTSALKHMANMGLLPKAVSTFIGKFIDIHKSRIDSQLEKISKTKPKKEE